MPSETAAIATAVAALGDRHAYDALLRRLDERSLCFDPDPRHRADVKRRLVDIHDERERAT